MADDDAPGALTDEERAFCRVLASDPLFSARRAARAVGRSTKWAYTTSAKPAVRREVERLAGIPWAEVVERNRRANALKRHQIREGAERAVAPPLPDDDPSIAAPEEVLRGMTLRARGDMGAFLSPVEGTDPVEYRLDPSRGVRAGLSRLIKSWTEETWTRGEVAHRRVRFELYDAHAAEVALARVYGLDDAEQRRDRERARRAMEALAAELPAHLVREVHLALLRRSEAALPTARRVDPGGNGHEASPAPEPPPAEWEP